MAAKKSAGNSKKKQDTFLEQTIANIEERAKKEIEDLRERIEGGLEEASTRANQRSSKLEEAFDKRVAQAYNRMGLPSKADVVLLESKIDTLQKTVDELLASGTAGKPEKLKPLKKTSKKTTAGAKKKAPASAKKKTANNKKAAARKATPGKKSSGAK